MNTSHTVSSVLSKLETLNVAAAVCGGWAEEAHGLTRPRIHKDIDLVVVARDFTRVDELFRAGELKNEIVGKRFFHKRAFIFQDTMVEMTLVQCRSGHLVTPFWGDTDYEWLSPLCSSTRLLGGIVRSITAWNLLKFRRSYKSLQPWRWRDPKSLVPHGHPSAPPGIPGAHSTSLADQ